MSTEGVFGSEDLTGVCSVEALGVEGAERLLLVVEAVGEVRVATIAGEALVTEVANVVALKLTGGGILEGVRPRGLLVCVRMAVILSTTGVSEDFFVGDGVLDEGSVGVVASWLLG